MPKCGSTTFQHFLQNIAISDKIEYIGELPTRNIGQAASSDATLWNESLPDEIQNYYSQFKTKNLSYEEFKTTVEELISWARSLGETKDVWLSSEFILSPQFLTNINLGERIAVLESFEDVNYLIISRPISQVISSIYRDSPNITCDTIRLDDELLAYVIEQYGLSRERILAYSSEYIEHLIDDVCKTKFFIVHLDKFTQYNEQFDFEMGALKYHMIQQYFSRNHHNSGMSKFAFLFRKHTLKYINNSKVVKYRTTNRLLKISYRLVLQTLNKFGTKKKISISQDLLELLENVVQNAIK